MGYTLKIYEIKDTTYEEIASLSLDSYSSVLRRFKNQNDTKEIEHSLQFILDDNNNQNLDNYEFLFQKEISKLIVEKIVLIEDDQGNKKEEKKSFEFDGYNLVRISRNSKNLVNDSLLIEFEK